LVTDQAERDGVIKLLRDMEAAHAWPTSGNDSNIPAWVTKKLDT
jgi:hypothetical protein